MAFNQKFKQLHLKKTRQALEIKLNSILFTVEYDKNIFFSRIIKAHSEDASILIERRVSWNKQNSPKHSPGYKVASYF